MTALFSIVGSVASTDTYYYDTCASTMDGTAYCCRRQRLRQLGNGLMSGMAPSPLPGVTAASMPLTGVTSVIDWNSAYKVCALKTDGDVVWRPDR